jgi:ABC-type phosphate/phosphonate transport system substrate-binding protein
MVPYSGIDEAQPVVVDLVSAIKTETGLVVEFRLVEQMSQALSALCNSGSSVGVAAWLDGLAYSIARSLGCGQPVLQVERGRGVGANTGVASSIIARKSLSINDLLELVGRRFCRINQADSLSWLVPSILMKKEGLSVTELRTVSDFDDTESLITAVVRGDCDAAGVPSDALDQFAEQFGDEYEKIAVVATSPVIPYSVLVVADDLPLSIQEGFGDALQRLAQNRTIGQKLQLLLNQSALQKAREIDFDDFIGFMMSVGMDFVQLGN